MLLLTGLGGATMAAAAEPPRLTQPVQATKFDLAPGRSYGSPYLAIDPDNELHVYAAVAELRRKRCELLRSTDGGETWARLEASPAPPSYPYCLMGNSHTFQGKVLFGRGGTMYYPLAGWDDQDGGERSGNVSLFVGRSDDKGDSWTTTAVANARGRQGQTVQLNRPLSGFAVDGRTGADDTVVVAWRRIFPGESAPNARAVQPTVSVSTDGARTFSEPVELAVAHWANEANRRQALDARGQVPEPTSPPAQGSRAANPLDPANFGGGNPSVTIGGDGAIYVAWVTTYSNLSLAPRPNPPAAHFLSKSTDKGRTWTTTQLTPYTREHVNTFGSQIIQWSPEGGGSLHFVYEGSKRPDIQNEYDIFYRRSTDGGQTWTEPRVLNDDDPSLIYFSGMPNMKVAPNGRIDVAWFDTRDEVGTSTNDVYYTSSSDNGETWAANIRVTDKGINRLIGPFAGNFDLNAPPGLASRDSYVAFGWDDTRFGDSLVETQDVFTATAQYSQVGGGSTTPTLVLFGMLGLVLAGVIMIAFSRLAARSSPAGGSRGGVSQPVSEQVG